MTDKKNQHDIAAKLRRQAEEKLRQEDSLVPESLLGLSPEEISQKLHDLRVYQIELEMQNEELRRTQEELGDSRARYFDLYDLAPVGYVTISETGLILETNFTAATLLCKARNELIKWPVTNFILKEDQDIYYRHRKQLFETGELQKFELRMVQTDKLQFWVQLDMTAAQDKCGVPICRITINDITKRKQAEEVLWETNARHSSMIENIGDVIGIMGSDSIMKYKSPNIERLFGWKPEDFVGTDGWETVHPEDIERIQKEFYALLEKENASTTVEYRYKCKDGTYRWIELTAINCINDTTINGVLLNYHDISDRKQVEERLCQAQKMESIGTLAGGIAHDFNNILFPILGQAEMLLEDVSEDSPFRPRVDQICTSAMRACKLVKQILTFSRQDTSELLLMKIQPAIKEALKLIRSTIPTTIAIKQYIRNDCGIIKADSTQIQQIIMNLAANAHHAMEDTGGELKINLEEIQLGNDDVITFDMAPGTYACLTVADTGTGMDKELTQKIFDPFFTTKEKGKGTGMGLSVVLGIVTNMGGTIQVYSEPGEGTEFKIYFPIEKSSFEEQNIQIKEPVRGEKERILLVDDEEAIVAMEKFMLERLNYQVTSHINSIEALESFRAAPDKFDLVITDMAMPNMAGDKLSAELIKIRPDIPVLICTGFSEKMTKEKAALLGIKGFLLKPIVMKDLAQKIREVLN